MFVSLSPYWKNFPIEEALLNTRGGRSAVQHAHHAMLTTVVEMELIQA